MNHNPILAHLGTDIDNYPPGIQCLLTQMGEQIERVRLMMLDYNAWAGTQPGHLGNITPLVGSRDKLTHRLTTISTVCPRIHP